VFVSPQTESADAHKQNCRGVGAWQWSCAIRMGTCTLSPPMLMCF